MQHQPGEAVVVTTEEGEIAIGHAAGALSVFEPDTGRIVGVNDAWVALYGYTREEALEMRVADVSAEPDETRSAVSRALHEGGARIEVRWHRRRDGYVFPVELTAGVLRVGSRKLMFAAMHDIDAKLRNAEALRRSEARYRALIESLPDAVIVHRNGELVYVNPAARRILGFADEDDVRGRPALDLVHPDDRDAVVERVRELVERGVPAPLREERLVRADGQSIAVEIAAIPTVFDGAPAILAMARDLSARKEIEARLVTADRLASIGRLAASVGHEINNPLAWVLGNVQLLQRAVSAQNAAIPETLRSELAERLSAVEQGATRVRDIVRDLKTLSRSEPELRASVDVNAVLDVCANMAEHEIRGRAQLVRDYGQDVIAEAREGRLGQVFLNLLVNAGQAVPEGDPEGNEVRITSRTTEEEIVVEVRDTGVGIAEPVRGRIFEPFFTTKGRGGTGLGLSITHHIVTTLGGSIEVFSVSPRGTAFVVRLPRAGVVPRSVRRPSGVTSKSRGHLLVVEDEELLAQVIQAQLESWEVTIAPSVRAALDAIAHNRAWDAILCDVLLDDGDGVELHDRIAAADPELARRVLFMTGGASIPRVAAMLSRSGRPCLEKPFTAEALERALAKIVAAPLPIARAR